MPYLPDTDLEFLKSSKQEELAVLVNLLTHTNSGKKRTLSRLTRLPRYKQFFPDHKKYWNLIAAEIQIYGGHTFANVITGSGVEYKEIVKNVCKKMGVTNLEGKSAEALEVKLLSKIMMGSLEKSSSQERQSLMGKNSFEIREYAQKAMRKELGIAGHLGGMNTSILTAFFAGSVAKMILGRTISFGLLKLLKFGLSKWVGNLLAVASGPLGIAATLTWCITDILKPDYKILIPVVAQVAFMRAMQKEKLQIKQAA